MILSFTITSINKASTAKKVPPKKKAAETTIPTPLCVPLPKGVPLAVNHYHGNVSVVPRMGGGGGLRKILRLRR